METHEWPNALLLVLDRSVWDLPDSMDGLIGFTPSCIAVGTIAPCDGEAEVFLTGPSSGRPGLFKAFEGFIETPSRIVSVCNVMGEVILEKPVNALTSRISIWVDDDTEPTIVEVQAS